MQHSARLLVASLNHTIRPWDRSESDPSDYEQRRQGCAHKQQPPALEE